MQCIFNICANTTHLSLSLMSTVQINLLTEFPVVFAPFLLVKYSLFQILGHAFVSSLYSYFAYLFGVSDHGNSIWVQVRRKWKDTCWGCLETEVVPPQFGRMDDIHIHCGSTSSASAAFSGLSGKNRAILRAAKLCKMWCDILSYNFFWTNLEIHLSHKSDSTCNTAVLTKCALVPL